jgi:tetratricopeptide (TPR) repeat protein
VLLFFKKLTWHKAREEWKEVVGFYEQAMAHNLKPLEAVEYLPFIKAYAALGEIEQALDLTKKAFAKSGSAKPPLCQLWKDILRENPTIPLSNVDSVYNSGNCSMIEP